MRNILTTCLVGLMLIHAVAGRAVAQRDNQPERRTGERKQKLKLYFKQGGAEVPSKRLLSRTEKLTLPKDKAMTFDFNVEVVDVGGLDVVSKNFDDELKNLIVTVRNNGATAPKDDPYLLVVVHYYRLYGTVITLPGPITVYSDGVTMPRLKPNEEFVFKFDLAKKGIVFTPAGPDPIGWPKIAVETYIVSGPIGF